MATEEAAKVPKEVADEEDWGGLFKARTLELCYLHGAARGRQRQRWYHR